MIEMKDILPKEKDLSATYDSYMWHLETLFLAYKYNNRGKFERSLNALRKFLPTDIYNALKHILDFSVTLK